MSASAKLPIVSWPLSRWSMELGGAGMLTKCNMKNKILIVHRTCSYMFVPFSPQRIQKHCFWASCFHQNISGWPSRLLATYTYQFLVFQYFLHITPKPKKKAGLSNILNEFVEKFPQKGIEHGQCFIYYCRMTICMSCCCCCRRICRRRWPFEVALILLEQK